VHPQQVLKTIQNQEEWLIDQMSVLLFNRLEQWANRNLMKFSKGKYQVQPLGRNIPMHQAMLGTDWKAAWQK